MELVEIRILPPIAIARMGNAETIAENYTLEENNSWQEDGFRTLRFAETIHVDETSGEASIDTTQYGEKVKPEDFKDSNMPPRVKPIAPFLEVWGIFRDDNGLVSDELVPLTPSAWQM